MTQETYELKGIKTFNGREGGGYEATLYLGSKKVGVAMNEGSGGGDCFRFNTKESEAAFQAFVNTWYETSESKAYWDAWSKEHELDTMDSILHKMECWTTEFIDNRESEKQLKRWSKTKTVFRLKGDGKGTWRTCNQKGDKIIQYIHKTYGDKVETIYGLPPTPTHATTAPSELNF